MLERGAHAVPVEDWAEVLLLLAPEDYAEPPAAEAPTTFLAGSLAKMKVMASRIAAGLSAFHPQDGLPAWREFVCEELAGDGWGLAVEKRGGRVCGLQAVCLQGRREPEPAGAEV